MSSTVMLRHAGSDGSIVPRGSSASDKGDPAANIHYPLFSVQFRSSTLNHRPKREEAVAADSSAGLFFSALNSSLSATFNVTITAKNPNKKVGVYYEGGSHISVWYTGTNLCQAEAADWNHSFEPQGEPTCENQACKLKLMKVKFRSDAG
uniref:Late embryogenesis abundant protein LEA-2 subgroup domain-containing protein n=1 Tax=Salix viminalis TaxID=40686 RepID=A0A6N2MP31_SALVM